jgi:hypothetical protein
MRARRGVWLAAAIALLAGCGGEDGAADATAELPRADVVLGGDAQADADGGAEADADATGDAGVDAEIADELEAGGDAASETEIATDAASDADADGGADADAETGPDVVFCVKGVVACAGDALTECVDPGQPPVLLTTCSLGCDPVLPACRTTCAPGEVLPCKAGVTRRCADSGSGAVTVARCLGACSADGQTCQPLGESDRTLPTGEGDIDEVARFAADGAGEFFGVVWSRVLAPSLHLLVTDHDGNVLHGPLELPGSQGIEPTQLQVVGRPGGGFGVMALEPDVEAGMAKFTLWRVDGGAPPVATLVIAGAHRSLPSLVALGEELAVYSVGTNAGGDILERQRFGLDGSASAMESVDSAGAQRFDVAAVRTGTDAAHVYAAISSGVRLSTSTLATASGSSKSIGIDDLLIANTAGAPGLSAVLALRFPEVGPEEFAYRIEGPGAGSWVSVGSADLVDWAFVALEAGGARVVTQDPSGALKVASGNATTLGVAKPLWSPQGGSTRTDFRLVRSHTLESPRLMSLGRDAPESPATLHVRRIPAL